LLKFFQKIQCKICDKKFTRLDHLNLHVASNHNESKPFQCEIAECKKGFLRQEHLKKHIEAKHSEGTKDKEICDICQKTFTSKKCLRTHMKSHSGEIAKGLTCKYCNVEFGGKTELNEHMSKDHQNEKPYLCSGKCFESFAGIREIKVRKYFSECGLRFVRNDYLVIHMRRHLGVKPYKCRFCEKGKLKMLLF
jgi:KRAB domain-containing zinc finger protein